MCYGGLDVTLVARQPRGALRLARVQHRQPQVGEDAGSEPGPRLRRSREPRQRSSQSCLRPVPLPTSLVHDPGLVLDLRPVCGPAERVCRLEAGQGPLVVAGEGPQVAHALVCSSSVREPDGQGGLEVLQRIGR